MHCCKTIFPNGSEDVLIVCTRVGPCVLLHCCIVCTRVGPFAMCSACHHLIFEAARVGEKAEQKRLATGCHKKWIQYSLHERAKLKMLATDSSWTDMNPRGCEHMTDRVFDLVNVDSCQSMESP